MSKIFCGFMIAMVMSVTASAHIWNRPGAQANAPHASHRLAPCPISYDFQHGFCVRPAAAKTDWFAQAIGHIL